MKVLKSMLVISAVALMHLSCQRELFFDGVSSGFLKKDVSGNCLPITANGVFTVDTTLNQFNYVEVQAEITMPGTYDIKSDTVNGYSFSSTGTVTKGINTIRLYASGKPIAAADNNFKVTYGTSTCNFKVSVSNTRFAKFTLDGAPNSCTGVFVNGTYIKDTALTAANKITLLANVTQTGIYSVSASTTDGFQFLGSGIFTSRGIQNITLTGTGTPLKAGVSNVIVTNVVTACDLNITVLTGGDNKAIFSFDGTPGACISPLINGTYYAGIVTAINNSVTMNINVTRLGIYSINTNIANGITFGAAGLFTITGSQTVTLYAAGIPIRPESTAFIPNTGTQSCNYFVDVQPLPPPAIFTLSGAPNACTPVTVNGFYIVSKPLDAANTVIIKTDVSTAGSYTIFTNTVNGITFSASGVFTSTGLQNVTLRGSGIPLAMGTTNLLPRYGLSFCNFSLTVL